MILLKVGFLFKIFKDIKSGSDVELINGESEKSIEYIDEKDFIGNQITW